MFQLKGHYYQNSFHQNESSESFTKKCPANLSQKLWECNSSEDVADQIADSALKGFKNWKRTSLDQRINILRKYQEILKTKSEEIALALALEVGKPLWEAKTEANALSSKVDVTINESLKRIENKHISEIMPNIDGHVYHKPLGPCLIIGPFNFPCHLANGQILSCLIAGNSIIFKPSEKTIYSAQLMFECLAQAGFPEGTINFAVGGAKISKSLVEHNHIKGVFFTGSKPVGLKIKESTLTDLSKLVALELGGKNASILCEDAPMEHSLAELVRACYLTTGQRCTSTGTILVHRKIYNEFSEKFAALSDKIIVDHPTEFKETPFMGSLIDKNAIDLLDKYLIKSQKEGAKTLRESKSLELNFEGFYRSPSIDYIENYDVKKHSFVGEEVFAPHCTLIAFDEIEEAINIANNTEFGLAGSVFTQNKSIYEQCVDSLDVGILNLNRSTVGASSKLPFGGVKSSGNHRPAAVSMIDACVYKVASLTTKDQSSTLNSITGLRKS